MQKARKGQKCDLCGMAGGDSLAFDNEQTGAVWHTRYGECIKLLRAENERLWIVIQTLGGDFVRAESDGWLAERVAGHNLDLALKLQEYIRELAAQQATSGTTTASEGPHPNNWHGDIPDDNNKA